MGIFDQISRRPLATSASLSARYFPNVSAKAVYSPHSLSVQLREETIDVSRVDDESYFRPWLFERLPVLVHEFQHGIDHIGTVVGRGLLDKLNGAYLALERNGMDDASELWRLMTLHDAQRRFDRRDYFTDFDREYRWLDEAAPRWQSQPSIGVGFGYDGRTEETDPIFFVRFNDSVQNRHVSRQPLTAAALFEARAVFAEMDQEVHALLTHRNTATWDAYGERQRRLFYEPSLTLYSAPAHLASIQSGGGDALDAYRMAAYAAGVILNLPPALELQVGVPDRYSDPQAILRARKLIENRDPGFLYAALIATAPPYEGDILAWLDTALERAGFPTRDTILDAALDYLAVPALPTGGVFDALYFSMVANGHGNLARLRATLGLLDFETMGRIGSVRGPIALPNTLTSNWMVSPPAEPFLREADQLALLKAEVSLNLRLASFLPACR